MESVRIFSFTEEPVKRYNGIRAVNETKTSIHFPEAESIFPPMFGNLIHGSQNGVSGESVRQLIQSVSVL